MRTAIADGPFTLNINCICCAFGPSSIASRGFLFGAETVSRNPAPEWDALSGWSFKRKVCPGIRRLEWDALSGTALSRKLRPRISLQSGMRFPDGMPSGNRVPEFGSRVGCAFRLSPSAETASRNKRSNWDAVSDWALFGKAYPILSRNSGSQFPPGGPTGNCDPF